MKLSQQEIVELIRGLNNQLVVLTSCVAELTERVKILERIPAMPVNP